MKDFLLYNIKDSTISDKYLRENLEQINIQIKDNSHLETEDNIDTLLKKAYILQELSAIDESKELLLSIYDKHPEHPLLLSYLSFAEISEGNFDKAIQYCNKSLEIDSSLTYSHKIKGICLHDRAMSSIPYEIDSDIDDIQLEGNKIDNDQIEIDLSASIESLTKALEIDDKYSMCYMVRALVYRNIGQFDESIRDLKKLIELCPNLLSAYVHCAFSYMQKGEQQASLVYLTEVLNMFPEEHNSKIAQAISHYQDGLYGIFQDSIKELVALKPNLALAYLLKGINNDQNKMFKEAIKDFSNAIEIDPSNQEIFLLRGLSYFQDKSYDLSINDFTRSLSLQGDEADLPDKADAYYHRGLSYMALGKQELADKDLRTAYQISPELFDNDRWDIDWVYTGTGALQEE